MICYVMLRAVKPLCLTVILRNAGMQLHQISYDHTVLNN